MIRLGDGTDESHRRAQDALDLLWPFTGELFEMSDAERALLASGVAVDPAPLRAIWRETVSRVVAEATLALPADGWMQRGGREGRHSEYLGHLLTDLQYLQRTHPGATW